MKTITTAILAFFTVVTLYSCTADDIENTSFKNEMPADVNADFSESMMHRDSISKDEDIDPPVRPKP